MLPVNILDTNRNYVMFLEILFEDEWNLFSVSMINV